MDFIIFFGGCGAGFLSPGHHRWTQAEALWFIGRDGFAGLRYVRFSSPVQMVTTVWKAGATEANKDTVIYGTSFFEPELKVNATALSLGFDSFARDTAILSPGGRMSGWDLFVSTEDAFGIGRARLSGEGARAAEVVNDGKTLTKEDFAVGMVQYRLTVGIKYRFFPGATSSAWAFGLGYAFDGLVLISYAGGPGGPEEVAPNMSLHSFLRHGPQFRFLARF